MRFWWNTINIYNNKIWTIKKVFTPSRDMENFSDQWPCLFFPFLCVEIGMTRSFFVTQRLMKMRSWLNRNWVPIPAWTMSRTWNSSNGYWCKTVRCRINETPHRSAWLRDCEETKKIRWKRGGRNYIGGDVMGGGRMSNLRLGSC